MNKCPKCGSKDSYVVYWDGYKCGGNRTVCSKCGYIIAEITYYASSPDLYVDPITESTE